MVNTLSCEMTVETAILLQTMSTMGAFFRATADLRATDPTVVGISNSGPVMILSWDDEPVNLPKNRAKCPARPSRAGRSYLDCDWNAVERAVDGAAHSFLVPLTGNREKDMFGSGGDHGIELQTFHVVSLNLPEEGLDDLDRRDDACREERPQLDTTRRQHVERWLSRHVGVSQLGRDVEKSSGVELASCRR